MLPSHTSVLRPQACSKFTCNDMLLSFKGLSGPCLIPAGITTFAIHRRKARQRRDPQGPPQKPSCQPSGTAAPTVGKTPQPAAGTPVQLQMLPREQHDWPAGMATEGRPSPEHLPRRKLLRSHGARLLRRDWFAVLLSCIVCGCSLQLLGTQTHWAAQRCRKLARRARGTSGLVLKATLCAVTRTIPLHAVCESCSSQRSRRTASCSSGRHRQALHAALMLPSPCQPWAEAGHPQELAGASAADAAWQDTEAGEGRPGHQRLRHPGFGCALQCAFEAHPAGERLPLTALSHAAGQAGQQGQEARLQAERVQAKCSQPSGQRGRQQPGHWSHQEAAPPGRSEAWQPQRLAMPAQHARDQSSDRQTGMLPPSSHWCVQEVLESAQGPPTLSLPPCRHCHPPPQQLVTAQHHLFGQPGAVMHP